MDIDEFLERLEPWRQKHRRRAFVPVFGANDSRSRFGGLPDMRPTDRWPVCRSCNEPMLFMVQVDLDDVPPDLGGGLLQLFYCSTDDGDCETWQPFAGASDARLIRGETSRRTSDSQVLTQRCIVGWSEAWDYPHPEEHERLGLDFRYDFPNRQVRVVCEELGFDEAGLTIDVHAAEAVSEPLDRDKLLGWPRFVQGREYPSCPQCEAEMELVFQIDSEVGTELMFGDLGIGHIMRCARHPDVLGFGWACS